MDLECFNTWIPGSKMRTNNPSIAGIEGASPYGYAWYPAVVDKRHN